MFPFLNLFWRYAISAIRLSEIFLYGDAGAGFFNACTSLFNEIVAFSDADLNGIAHPWEKIPLCLISLTFWVFLVLPGGIYNDISPC